MDYSGKLGKKGLHFGGGVGVAFFGGGGNAGGEDLLGFGWAGFASEELGVHEVGGDVVGVAIEEGAEMGVGGCGVAVVHALHGQAVAGKGIFGFFRQEFFKHLATGFLLFCH